MTPWTVAHQASLSMGFSRQKCWSGLPFHFPRNLSNPEAKPLSHVSPVLARGFITTSATWEAHSSIPAWTQLSVSFSSVQFSHLVMSDSLPPCGLQHAGLPVHHQLLEFTQNHMHWVNDAIQQSHPLSVPSLSAFSLSQHQGLFQ